ncbi:NAD(P)H-binding protein [Chryseobacterium sp. ERMR1:04]|uniref:NAD(P)H-binding protein n=1 Tax=Chryseobacterium sp. ERMR1:04 TaxID=1705393 RepID=UPI0006C86DDE|nr:NAD(P)H-binding protein [Chryseobacterium sp. ERMR1:04]KPH14339.1 NAD-dependent dehydratase [Chryseobacterium sp. ERMR1:04]
MKKVLIIGATGSLAKYVVEAVKPLENIELTLFVRNKNRLSKDLSDNCEIIEGDALNFNDIKNAVKGKDIVYINLDGDLETMTGNIVQAMQEEKVKRIIGISSIGIYTVPLRPVLVPYRKLADIIESSGLNYTILRPDWFTNVDEVDYETTIKGSPEIGSAISRKSIADFVSKLINYPNLYINENLGISKPN